MMLPEHTIHVAAGMGYQISPDALNILTSLSYFETVGLFYEMGRMFPEALVFNLNHVCDVLGTLIVLDVPGVEA